MMRRTIRSNQSCPVKCKNNMKMLQTYIVYYLIKSPLKKSRIYSYNRYNSLCCKPGCKCNRMLFCYSNIEIIFRKFFLKQIQTCSVGHSAGYTHHQWILPNNLYQSLTKNFGIWYGTSGFMSFTCQFIKRSRSVEPLNMRFCRFITFTFLSNNVDKNWSFKIFNLFKN